MNILDKIILANYTDLRYKGKTQQAAYFSSKAHATLVISFWYFLFEKVLQNYFNINWSIQLFNDSFYNLVLGSLIIYVAINFFTKKNDELEQLYIDDIMPYLQA